jgi:hypothetical protein
MEYFCYNTHAPPSPLFGLCVVAAPSPKHSDVRCLRFGCTAQTQPTSQQHRLFTSPTRLPMEELLGEETLDLHC